MVIINRYSVKFNHLGRSYDSIHPRDSLNFPTKSGLVKLLNTTLKPEVWLALVSWISEVQDSY